MSIRVRLTVWYIAVLGLILLIFSAAFYNVLKFSLITNVDRDLQDRARQVAAGIEAQNNLLDILGFGRITLPQLEVFSSQAVYIQIADSAGAVIETSPNLMESQLPINQDILLNINLGRSDLRTVTIDTAHIRIYSVPLIFGNQLIGMVQVAHSLNEVETTLQLALFFLISGTVVALLLAALFGILLAHLSLRPIDRITLTANRIVSAQDLSRRLPVSNANDELNRLSLTINHMLARLDNFFQAQVRLSADISHELRTPLTIIRGNVNMLHREDTPPEDRGEAFAAINSALDRMTRLVSDLLLLSQADAGMTLNKQPLNLDGVILEVFQEAHTLSGNVQLKLGHADQAGVCGDADRLKQLLINLIDNAIKHTPAGGCVTLAVYVEADQVRVSVADTGAGISPEDLPHVFDRFYRAKGQNRKGSGLGLAIAKWIAEAHGGTLTVESKPGMGSTFTLRLPLDTTRPYKNSGMIDAKHFF